MTGPAELITSTVISKSIPKIRMTVFGLSIIIIFSGVITCLIGLFTISPWAPGPIRSPFDITTLLPLFVWILNLIGQIVILIFVVRFLRHPQPALVVNQDGFTYWISIFKVETVPWKSVERIDLSQDRFAKLLTGRFCHDTLLTLSVYTGSGPKDWTIWERTFRWLGTGDKVFMAPYLARRKREVFDLLQAYFSAWKLEEHGEFESATGPESS